MIAEARRSIEEEIERITSQPYTLSAIRNEDGSWFAHVAEFDGCMTEGNSREQALDHLDEAMRLWVRTHIEDSIPVPPPQQDGQFSGKFVVRVARTVHRALTERARREGVSLNLLVSTALSRFVGT